MPLDPGILTTKLYRPRLTGDLVSRPRLLERLEDRRDRPLPLVSAPAGYGKTTLVSEWAQAMDGATPPIAIAWLSLDEGDNDPARFLSYLVAALLKCTPLFGHFFGHLKGVPVNCLAEAKAPEMLTARQVAGDR